MQVRYGAADKVNSPTTGASTQWVVDAITIPASASAATQVAFDLDGDGIPDNRLGQFLAALQVEDAGFVVEMVAPSIRPGAALAWLAWELADHATPSRVILDLIARWGALQRVPPPAEEATGR